MRNFVIFYLGEKRKKKEIEEKGRKNYLFGINRILELLGVVIINDIIIRELGCSLFFI